MTRTEDDAAFTEYVTARQRQYRRLAYTLCGDWHRAEDLAQTALGVAPPRTGRAATDRPGLAR